LLKEDVCVAVITRTKDRPLLLDRCIQSVLAQDFDDWIHVIVNDGGDPLTLQRAIDPYRQLYRSRLLLLHHGTSRGMEAASNTALRESRSRFVTFLDDDDTWDPSFLATTVATLMSADSELIKGVACQTEIIREYIEGDQVKPISRESLNAHLTAIRVDELIMSNLFTNNAFLFFRSAQEEIGFYSDALPVLGDWDFNIRFALRFEICVVSRILARWHWRERSEKLEDLNSRHHQGAPHDIWRIRLINQAIRGNWLDGKQHLPLILVLGNKLAAIEQQATQLKALLDQKQAIEQSNLILAQNLAQERREREEQAARAEEQLGRYRVWLQDRERDLSQELVARGKLNQELGLVRRNAESAERTLRVADQLEGIAARTSPIGAPRTRLPAPKQIVSTLQRVRKGAGAATRFMAAERLRLELRASVLFDEAWYLSQRPDLQTAKHDPLNHFVLYGIDEGTSPHPFIDVDWIARSTGESHKSALRNYLLHGRRADLRPTPLFDVQHYRKIAGLSASDDALSHYLLHGRAAGLSPHPLFDRAYYSAQMPRLGRLNIDPFLHYVLYPFELDPHPLFSTQHYLSQHPELQKQGVNPLLHYLEYGFLEKTSPHWRFSGSAYLERHPDVAATELNPLLHYVIFGKVEGRKIDPAGW